jgi:hypothetical protein
MPTDKVPSKRWKSVKSLISWQAAGTDSLKETIVRVTQSGNAIMFSTTMDGSALILSVYAGNDKTKEYVTDAGDIPSLLAYIIETYG